MRLVVLVLAVSACSGIGSSADEPREAPTVRLVSCVPALPPPLASEAAIADSAGSTAGVPSWSPRRGSVAAAEDGTTPRRKASVSLGIPTASASIDTAQLTRVISGHLPELRACFEQEMLAEPTLQHASLAWRLAVAQDGRVLYADPTVRKLGSRFPTCVSRTLRTMVFPARQTRGSVLVTYPLVFAAVVAPPPPAPVQAGAGAPWTPFAIRDAPVPRAAVSTARATEAALRARRDALTACFPAASPTGSLRALLELDANGVMTSVRAGGLGHEAIERCVERALVGTTVISPLQASVVLACDYARGDAEPWRLTTARHHVIETTREQLRYGEQRVSAGSAEVDALPGARTYLVLAEPDATGLMIALALTWAHAADAAIVAVRDPTRPPLFVGMGKIAESEGEPVGNTAVMPTLRLGTRTLTACIGRAALHVELADRAAVGGLVRRVAQRCKTIRCAATLHVTFEPDALARELVEVAGAARRAGFERVLLGGDTACGVPDDGRDRE